MYDLLAADIGGHGRLAMARGLHPVDQDNRIDFIAIPFDRFRRI
jgi:hypothetical protein